MIQKKNKYNFKYVKYFYAKQLIDYWEVHYHGLIFLDKQTYPSYSSVKLATAMTWFSVPMILL